MEIRTEATIFASKAQRDAQAQADESLVYAEQALERAKNEWACTENRRMSSEVRSIRLEAEAYIQSSKWRCVPTTRVRVWLGQAAPEPAGTLGGSEEVDGEASW